MVIPAPGFEPAATLRAVAAGAVHVAVRRADDVHRRAGPTRTSDSYDLSQPAHRDHGRLAVPGRGDEAGVVERMHMDEVTICYGMTETSPVSTQTRADDDARAPGLAPSAAVHPHVEVKVVDPETGRVLPRGDAGRAVHPRLLGDARLLGRAGEDRGGDRRARAGCTPATSRRWTTTAT